MKSPWGVPPPWGEGFGEKEVCEELGLGISSWHCALIAASSRGPWWADSWSTQRSVMRDSGISAAFSFPCCMLPLID